MYTSRRLLVVLFLAGYPLLAAQNASADITAEHFEAAHFSPSHAGESQSAAVQPAETQAGRAPSGSSLQTMPQRATVTGRVIDAETGGGLPYANIQVVGRMQGTVTNEDGVFRLVLTELPANLAIRYIGYESRRIEIGEEGPFDVVVRMSPTTYELGGIVVSDVDPAVSIMRKVIERKEAWRGELETYIADAYNRYTIANDTGIVMITETATRWYWRRRDGTREIVQARRATANAELDDVVPDDAYVLNLYDDDVEIAGYRFVGVTHPDALDVYDFELDSVRVLDEQAVYDIAVRPKRRTAAAFVGRIAVLDSAYALLEVDLTPGDAFVFPPPLNAYDIRLTQQFSNFGGSFWLPVDFRSTQRLKISWGLLLSLPAFNIEQSSRLSNYDVNVPVPDSLFDDEDFSRIDSASVAHGFIDSMAVVPLTSRERDAYNAIDSTLTFQDAFKPSGLMASAISFEEEQETHGLVSGFRVVPQFRRNRVEEYRIGALAEVSLGSVRWQADAAHLTALGDWSYGTAARLPLGLPGDLTVIADYHDGVEARRPAAWIADSPVEMSALVAASNQDDYFRNERMAVGISAAIDRIGGALDFRLRSERHASLSRDGEPSFSADPAQRVNPPVHQGRLRSLGARITLGEEILFGVSGGNRLELSIEHSDAALGSDFEFTQLAGAVDVRIETMLRRRFLPAVLDAHLVAGGSFGELPLQRTASLRGSAELVDGFYMSSFGDLRALKGRAYQGDRFAGVFWEHNFRSAPFELLSVDFAARRGWSLIVHGGHVRTWMSDRLTDAAGYDPIPDAFHHEVGLSVSGIFGLFRLDATRRLDSGDTAFGVGMARIL